MSALQEQFPLSPRKFWKKLVPKLVGIIILDLIFTALTGGALLVFFGSDTTLDPGHIAGSVFLLFVIFLILFAIHAGLYAWYIKTYIARYYYAGEEHFITIKKGVFAPAEIHVQWQKIQDVYVDQDILDRIMGLYDVHIASATAASGIEAHIDGVDAVAAEGLKQFLLDKVSSAGKGTNVQNTSATSPSDQPVAQPLQQTPTIHLTEEISSNTYPLTGKWFALKIITALISPFLYWGVILFFVFAKLSKDVSPEDYQYFILGYFGISILSAIAHVIGAFLWRKNYAFNFTPDNIYYREGVLSISEKHMPYSSIQDVAVSQGIIERLFGLAKVRIENAATRSIQTRNGAVPVFTGVIIQGLSLADANKITDLLKTTVLGKNTSGYGL